jgi:hypothetical protein
MACTGPAAGMGRALGIRRTGLADTGPDIRQQKFGARLGVLQAHIGEGCRLGQRRATSESQVPCLQLL